MISWSTVASTLGFTDTTASFAEIARYLRQRPPVSLQSVSEQASYVTSFALDKPIRDKWGELNWGEGPLGLPVSPTLSTPDGFVRYARFEGGSVYWTSLTNAHAVLEPIRAKYEEVLAQADPDNHHFARWVPVTDTARTLGGLGVYDHFRNYFFEDYWALAADYSIYWSQDTDAHWVGTEIRNLWLTKLGGPNGFLGFPTIDEINTIHNLESAPPIWEIVETSHFRNGMIVHQGNTYAVYAPESRLKSPTQGGNHWDPSLTSTMNGMSARPTASRPPST